MRYFQGGTMKSRMVVVATFFVLLMTMVVAPAMGENTKLRDVYNNVLKKAKYIDLTWVMPTTQNLKNYRCQKT